MCRSWSPPVERLTTLNENCAQIARCKTVLRGWGEQVDDHPDDSVESVIGSLDQRISELEVALRQSLSDAARTRVAQSLEDAQERRNILVPLGSASGTMALRLLGTVSGVLGRFFSGKDRSQTQKSESPSGKPGELHQDYHLSAESTANSSDLLNDWRGYAAVDHDVLFGVKEALASLGAQFANPEANWIISVFGESGIGKTALAYELVRRYHHGAGFTRIAWVSAKPMRIDSIGKAVKEKDVAYFWNDLIVEIVDRLHLDLQYSPSTWELEFPRIMRRISRNERCLIVIDNLETIDDVSETIKYLEQYKVINPHKFIITTRMSVKPFSNQVREYQITGLSRENARAFIRHLGTGDANISSSSFYIFSRPPAGRNALTAGMPMYRAISRRTRRGTRNINRISLPRALGGAAGRSV